MLKPPWMQLHASDVEPVLLPAKMPRPCFLLLLKYHNLLCLPQGKIEAKERVLKMVAKMDELGFGNCTNTGACEAECPKQISISHIARLNREYLSAKLT